MSFSLVLLACWLYAGRALLLGVLFASGGLNKSYWTTPLAVSIGLLITPVVFSAVSVWPDSFTAVLIILLFIDLLLVLIIFRRIPITFRLDRLQFSIFLIFCFIVFTLTWFNGPFMEQISDSWWHMRSVFWLKNNETLVIPVSGSGSAILNEAASILGADYSSYRFQAFLSWVSGRSIVNSWIASGVAVGLILGASVYLLLNSLQLNFLAICLSLVFWLLLLGGMNTGIRLTAWPAGMGYVFLNLGLIACFQLYRSAVSMSAWFLLFVCVLGAFFFHFAELFLLILALSSLLTVRIFLRRLYPVVSFVVLVLTIACLFILLEYFRAEKPVPLSAFLGTSLILISFWGIGALARRLKPRIAVVSISGIVLIVLYIVIDWSHVSALFHPDLKNIKDYYAGYIPHYIQSWDGQFLIIAKWEHQLRASILWSGVAGFFLAFWNFWNKKDQLSQWLLILMVIPWIILVSPSVFTSISTVIPIYGTYRVQFLMPTFIVLGLVLSDSLIHISQFRSTFRAPVSIPHSFSTGLSSFRISYNTLYIICLGIGSFLLYRLSLIGLNNFSATYPPHWLNLIFVLVTIFAVALRVSWLFCFHCILVLLCLLLVTPDSMVRSGASAERSWAIHSNLNFHWRLSDNRNSIKTHSSWRYQEDLENIQKIVKSNQDKFFISDLATSYYVAAETELKPLIQQAHHSTFGIRYNEIFQELCSGASKVHEFLEKVSRLNSKRFSSGPPESWFIIINKDTLNYTAEVLGTYCVGETTHFSSKLEHYFEKSYDGKHLSLWKLYK